MFTDKEKETLFRTAILAGAPGRAAYVLRIAEDTARILAARGGTMTADEIHAGLEADRARQHFAVQGATVAMLREDQRNYLQVCQLLERGDGETPQAAIRRLHGTIATLQAKVADLESDLTRLLRETVAGSIAGDLYRTTAGRGVADVVAGALVAATKERMTLTAEVERLKTEAKQRERVHAADKAVLKEYADRWKSAKFKAPKEAKTCNVCGPLGCVDERHQPGANDAP